MSSFKPLEFFVGTETDCFRAAALIAECKRNALSLAKRKKD
jgi:hypothetical protein